VFGGARLAQAEPVAELADRTGPFQEQIEDAPPSRLGEDVEGCWHDPNVPSQLYNRNGMYREG
jgi:hypothetical protein